MKFNTHEETPAKPASPELKIALVLLCILVYGIFAYLIILAWSSFDFVFEKVIICAAPIFFTLVCITFTFDVPRAYVELSGDKVIVVDYYFFIKRERHLLIQDIETVEDAPVGPGRGYQIRGEKYLYFRNAQGKYLFKLINLQNNKDLILQYLRNASN